MDTGYELTCGEVRFALRRLGGQAVEIGQWKASPSGRSEDLDLGVQRRQRHGQIRSMGRDAGRAGAEQGSLTVLAEKRAASGAGSALVAGESFGAKIEAARPLERIAANRRHVAICPPALAKIASAMSG